MYLSHQVRAGKTYLFLMESYYDRKTKKAKKRRLIAFGNEEKLKLNHPERYRQILEKYGSPKSARATAHKKALESLDADISNQTASVGGFLYLNLSLLILHPLWEKILNLDGFLSRIAVKESSGLASSAPGIAEYLTMLKLALPDRQDGPVQLSMQFLNTPMEGVSTSQCAETLSWLGARKIRIMEHLGQMLAKAKARKSNQLVCDSFEIAWDEMNDADVSAVMLSDENGLPVDFELWSKASPEIQSKSEAMKKFKSRHGEEIKRGDRSEMHQALRRCLRTLKGSFVLLAENDMNQELLEGHAATCVIALAMMRLIEMRLEEQGASLSPVDICGALSASWITAFSAPGGMRFLKSRRMVMNFTTKGRTGCVNQREDILLSALGLGKIGNVMVEADLREAFGVRSIALSKSQMDCMK
jgi:hypothetical protein